MNERAYDNAQDDAAMLARYAAPADRDGRGYIRANMHREHYNRMERERTRAFRALLLTVPEFGALPVTESLAVFELMLADYRAGPAATVPIDAYAKHWAADHFGCTFTRDGIACNCKTHREPPF